MAGTSGMPLWFGANDAAEADPEHGQLQPEEGAGLADRQQDATARPDIRRSGSATIAASMPLDRGRRPAEQMTHARDVQAQALEGEQREEQPALATGEPTAQTVTFDDVVGGEGHDPGADVRVTCPVGSAPGGGGCASTATSPALIPTSPPASMRAVQSFQAAESKICRCALSWLRKATCVSTSASAPAIRSWNQELPSRPKPTQTAAKAASHQADADEVVAVPAPEESEFAHGPGRGRCRDSCTAAAAAADDGLPRRAVT